MSKLKKRAFVRYSKKGLLVPGSLIVTNGSYPNGPSKWFEVPVDLCCTPEDCCTPPPVVCKCYLLVNPNFGGEPLGYNYKSCEGSIAEGSLSSGQYVVVCAQQDSLILQSGLLSSEEGLCSLEVKCLGPEQVCVTYYISNNTGGFITIGYTGCGGGESGFINLPPGANTAICATLGSVDAPGATINLAVIGCA